MLKNYPKDASLIHLFRVEGQPLVFDTNSCIFFALDGLAKDVIELSCMSDSRENLINALLIKYSHESAEKAVTELESLEKRGILFSSLERPTIVNRSIPPPSTLCLCVSHDCNLRCDYCFTRAGSFKKISNLFMSFEVAKSAVDYLIANTEEGQDLNLSFFGGEPLLNFNTIVKTVEYISLIKKKKRIHIGLGITTNGTLLDQKKIEFLNHNHFSIILSIDGPPEIHDSQRPFVDGRGSHAETLNNLQKVKATRPNQEGLWIRGTFTRKNLRLPEMVLYLNQHGCRDISVEPAHTKLEEFAWQKGDLETVKSQYTELARKYLEEIRKGIFFSFFHFKVMMDTAYQKNRNITQCGAGTGYLAVGAEGFLYPCHKLVGDMRFKLGSVFNGIERKDIQNRFAEAHVYNKKNCLECWARFICGGGCHAYNIEFNDDLFVPYDIECEMMKNRIETGAYLYSQLSSKERSLLGYASNLPCVSQPV